MWQAQLDFEDMQSEMEVSHDEVVIPANWNNRSGSGGDNPAHCNSHGGRNYAWGCADRSDVSVQNHRLGRGSRFCHLRDALSAQATL